MLAVLVAGCFGCAKPGHRRSWLSWLLDALAVRDSDALAGIALIEAALGDMAGILRESRGELKPAEPSDELTVPGPAGGDSRPPAVFINSGAGVGHQAGKEPLGRRAESPEQLPGHRMHYQIQGLDDRGLRLMGPHHLGLQAQIPTP